MSERKHTPGPWSLNDRGYTYIISKPSDGYITRDVCRMDGSTMAAFDQKANAHLIAAAPDMLAALKEVREQCLFDDDHGIGVSEDVVIPAELFDRVCDAIAKAEPRNVEAT